MSGVEAVVEWEDNVDGHKVQKKCEEGRVENGLYTYGVSDETGMERMLKLLHRAAYLPEAGPASAHFAAEAGFILKQEVAARLRGVMNDRYFGPQGLAAARRRDMGWELGRAWHQGAGRSVEV